MGRLEQGGFASEMTSNILFYINIELIYVLGQYELFTDQYTKDHLAQTIGNGDPKHGVCIYLAHGNSKGEARGRNMHKSNNKRVVKNLEERNEGKNPKEDLEDKTIELSE